MSDLTFVNEFTFGRVPETDKAKSVNTMSETPFAKVMTDALREGEILASHSSSEPIGVLCLSEPAELRPGTHFMLPAGIDHEVRGHPAGAYSTDKI